MHVCSAGRHQTPEGVQQLLPQGLHVIGSYTAADQAAWQPGNTPAGVPRVTTVNTSSEASWSINGSQGQVQPAAAGQGLEIAAGFVPIRCGAVTAAQHVFQTESVGWSAYLLQLSILGESWQDGLPSQVLGREARVNCHRQLKRWQCCKDGLDKPLSCYLMLQFVTSLAMHICVMDCCLSWTVLFAAGHTWTCSCS